MVELGRSAEEVTNVDARLQALVQRILSETVKQALDQAAIEDTQKSSKRQKTISASKDGGIKKPLPTKSTGERGIETMTCYRCHELGHRQLNCPNKQRICYGCGVVGHRLAYCPRGRGGRNHD